MRLSIPFVTLLTLSIACAGGDSSTSDTGDARSADAAADTRPLSAPLAAQGESGVNGNVTLSPQGSGVAVAVHVMGTAGTYTAHVHQGSCSASGESAVVADLGSVIVPAGGMVDHNASATLSLDSLGNGQHFVGLHREAGGPHIACADLRR